MPAERNCSVARTVGILSDAWAFLVLRESFFGARRFEIFQSVLGIPRATLSARLAKLTAQGILRQEPYSTRPVRHEYRLTRMGLDLYPSMVALMRFGDKFLAGQRGVPLRLFHRPCGRVCHPQVVCSVCGGEIAANRVRYRNGPGAGPSAAPPTRRLRQSADHGQFERGRPCSVARTLRIIGNRWSFLIIREAFFGVRRFDALQSKLAIASNILADRLAQLTAEGILERTKYQNLPERYEYRLTPTGKDLYGPLIAMMAWGDRWLSSGKPPLILTHLDCDSDFTPTVACDHCRQPIEAHDMRYRLRYERPVGRPKGLCPLGAPAKG